MQVTFINPPKECDLCRSLIGETFVDGRTCYGPWAIMCPACFEEVGTGLGTGLGQKYQKKEDGNYVKVEG